MRRREFSKWLVVLSVFSLPSQAAANTWWVDASAPTGGDGSSSAPFQRVQRGIDSASNGDIVRVRPGVYFERIDFLVKSIRVVGEAGAAATVLHGDQLGSVVRLEGVSPSLEGFTVENGAGDWIGYTNYGGGILFDDASDARVIDCIVRDNFAILGDGVAAVNATGVVVNTLIENNGGPAYVGWCQLGDSGGGVYGNPQLWLVGCTIRNNKATNNGGGVCGASLDGCLVVGNSASEGAGICGSYAIRTTIQNNRATSCDASYSTAGGALNSTLEDCFVLGNDADFDAGGARGCLLRRCVLRGNGINPIEQPGYGGGALGCALEDCVVEDNFINQSPWNAPGWGGGASGGSALRTVFRNNSAFEEAGVSWTTLDRCVVYGNIGGGASSVSITNSIVYGNIGEQVLAATFLVAYSNVEGGFPGVGVIDVEPLFWNAVGGDFHLRPKSPCIDAGDPTQSDPDGSRADMGAFPYSASDCLPVVAYCPAGQTSDGCAPTLSAFGSSSLSLSQGFELRCSGLPGRRSATVLYGVSGATEVPWTSTSSLCVAPPRQRTLVQSTDHTAGACDGEISLDFHVWRLAQPQTLGAPFSPGDVVWAQAWCRDPGASIGTNFSGAIRFMLCP